jgi:hypothetical protein
MAINPESQYPGKIAPGTPDYPYGAARNIAVPGDGTGTPWEAALVNDLFGFQQALLSQAGVVPTGTPEKATESQYLTAILRLVGTPLNDISGFNGLTGGPVKQRALLLSWRPGNLLGGGIFFWNASRSKDDHDGGNVLSPTVPAPADFITQSEIDDFIQGAGETDPGGTGVWERQGKQFALVEDFGGAGDNSFDNTVAYGALIAAVPEGTRVVFGTQGTYLGNFVSADKSLRVDLNGATLTDTDDNTGIVIIGAFDAVAHDVSEATLNNGDTQFTVIGASGLFSVGDIGYLWDQAVRPTGGAVNYEVVKIADIAGDVITVEGFIAAHQGAAAIKFYHSTNQLKGPEITNGHIKPSATHVSFGAACFNSEHVSISRIQVEGAAGNGVAARFCYDVDIEKIKPLKPRAAGSGQGYGVALLGVSQFRIKDIIGLSNRHVYDQDSAYFGDIENVSDMDDQSAPVTLAHNGFTGYISCKNVRVKTSQYPVVLSSQGYGGTPSADKSNHPFRNITIDGVDAIIRDTVSPNSSNILGVYFQNSTENVDVRNIRTKLLNGTALASGAGTYIVRVRGIARGYFNLSNVDVNKIGAFFFSEGARDGLAYDDCIANFRNLRAGAVDYAVRTQGLWAVNVDNVSLESDPISDVITYMETVGGDSPQGAYIGGTIQYPGIGVEMLRTSGVGTIPGVLPQSSKSISSSIVVSAGQALTQAEIQERGRMVRLTSPVGAGTLTLSATDALPAPTVRDIDLKIAQPNSGRQAVEFPAGDNITGGFTIAENEVVHLYQNGGKWQLFGRYTSS